MKRNLLGEVADFIFVPLITYIAILLIISRVGDFAVTWYVVWAVMAGACIGVVRFARLKAVTVGICAYNLLMMGGIGLLLENDGWRQALLICVSYIGIGVIILLMKLPIIRVLSGFSILGVMILFRFWDVDFPKITVALGIVLFLNGVSELIGIFYKGNVKSLIVIYVIVGALSITGTVREEPYNWQFVYDIWYGVENMITEIVTEIRYNMMADGGNALFHFGFTGYSDSGMDLSAGLYDTDIEQLWVAGDRTSRNMYLKGNICNKFIGNAWENKLPEGSVDYRVDALMTLYAIFDATDDPAELQKFMSVKEQEITFCNIKTKSLFYPMKALFVSAKTQGSEPLWDDKVNVRDFKYSYVFVDVDYASSRIADIISNAPDIVYNEAKYNRIYENLREIYGVEVAKIPFEDFCEMAKASKKSATKEYIALGDYVSEQAVDLSKEIVAGADMAFDGDYGVCKALERYLYRYKYNKLIEASGNNMLDWFLFEGKEGYCAHFATALAIMLRCQGIPSRVVEGFLVDYGERVDSYTYSISSDLGHVWVEAYLDGFGWVRLEPTVINAANANAVWYVPDSDDVIEEPEEIVEDELGEGAEETEISKQSWELMLWFFGGMVLVTVVIMLATFIGKRLATRKSMDPDVVFDSMIQALGRHFVKKYESETFGEYVTRLSRLQAVSESASKTVPEDISKEKSEKFPDIEDLREIQAVLEKYWYGNGDVPEEIVMKMKIITNNR